MSALQSILGNSVRSTLARAIGAAGGGGGFSPLSLFASGEQGAWYDPSDLSSMFVDSAGTIAAAVGQPVGRILDKSGRGNHATQATGTARPSILRDGNGNNYLDLAGAQFLSAALAQSTYPLTLVVAVKSDADIVSGAISVTASTVIYHGIIKTGTAGVWAATDRNAAIVTDTAPLVGNNTTAHVLRGEYTGTTVEAVMDGQTNGATASANAFGAGDTLWLGCLRSGSEFLDGRIYQALAINRILSASEVANVQSFFGSKAAVTL